MSLPAAFRSQAEACAGLGSPFMGKLLTMLADHWPENSALGQKFAGFEGDIGPAGHSLPLRIAGGLHGLRGARLAERPMELSVRLGDRKVVDAGL